jgi:hypothetical protein
LLIGILTEQEVKKDKKSKWQIDELISKGKQQMRYFEIQLWNAKNQFLLLDFHRCLYPLITSTEMKNDLDPLFKYFQNYQNFLQFSIESKLSYIDYITLFKNILKQSNNKKIENFSKYEKLSYNKDCIPDESLIHIQIYSLLSQQVKLELVKLTCDLCLQIKTFKIVLSNCYHCYCFDCMEEFCSEVTQGTMKSSIYKSNENQNKSQCKVNACNFIVTLKDAEKCGVLFGISSAKNVNNN